MFLTNAFSLNMLVQPSIRLQFEEISLDDATLEILISRQRGEEIVNAIGHGDTDSVVRSLFHRSYTEGENPTIPIGRRISVAWPLDTDTDATMLVAQYRGPRLPEGATSLPEGAEIVWWRISFFAE